jgi:4-hydroxy-tetrahydrodipicolinate synthase
MFEGALVALITPLKQGTIDQQAIHKLVEWHIEQGTQGLVACGCTGEGFCLSLEEQQTVIKTVMEVAQKRIPVIASASAITPEETVKLAYQAEANDVDGLMVITPPVVKPTQQALCEYFQYINDRVKTPIIVYDNPARTGTPIHNETVIKIARLSNIVALKDSSGDVTRLADLLPYIPQDFTILSGDDFTTGGFYAYGGHGTISVAGNIAPHLMVEYWQAWQQGNTQRFVELGQVLAPLHKSLFCENSPAPTKYGASLLGLCRAEVRPPLKSITPAGAQKVEDAMAQAGLLSLKQPAHG